jgi:hypothetical protein
MNKFILNEYSNRIKNYEGMINYELTAKKYSHTKNKQTFWFFKCTCGNEKLFRPNKVFSLSKGIKNCGCKRDVGGNPAINLVYKSYKGGAKRRNLNFNLSKNEFKEITSKKCHYCNIEPATKSKTITSIYLYNGIDRKDNKIGYELFNCLPCCTLCNKAKRDLDYNVFIDWINRFKNNVNLINI